MLCQWFRSSKCRAIVANTEPFGTDVHQCAGLSHSTKCNGSCATPTRIGHCNNHVATGGNHCKHFDLSFCACCQSGSFWASCGKVTGGLGQTGCAGISKILAYCEEQWIDQYVVGTSHIINGDCGAKIVC